jgi:hypothetical protein
MNKTFDDYLMESFVKDYHGTDDDMPDNFENWKNEFDIDILVGIAEGIIEAQSKMIDGLNEAIGELKKIRDMATKI